MEIVSTFVAQAQTEDSTFTPAGAPQLRVTNYTDHVASAVFLGLYNGAPAYNVKLGEKYIWVAGSAEEKSNPFFTKSIRFTFFDQPGVAALGGNQGAVSAIMSMVQADVAIREEDSADATTWVLVDTTGDEEFHQVKFVLSDDTEVGALDMVADGSDDADAVNE